MASVESVLDAADLTAANCFCTAAHRRPASHVNGFIGAGATPLSRRRSRSGPQRRRTSPDRTIWQVSTLAKKDIGGDAGPSTDPDGFAS
jgi:hypothetical protein